MIWGRNLLEGREQRRRKKKLFALHAIHTEFFSREKKGTQPSMATEYTPNSTATINSKKGRQREGKRKRNKMDTHNQQNQILDVEQAGPLEDGCSTHVVRD